LTDVSHGSANWKFLLGQGRLSHFFAGSGLGRVDAFFGQGAWPHLSVKSGPDAQVLPIPYVSTEAFSSHSAFTLVFIGATTKLYFCT
jgi:hypothetical protein